MPTHAVCTTFLCDPDLDDWPVEAMWMYFCLWANPECNGLTGIYRKPSNRLLKLWTRLDDDDVFAAAWKIVTDPIKRGSKMSSAKVHVTEDGWIWVVGKANHSIYNSPQAQGAVKSLIKVPEALVKLFIGKYRARLADCGVVNIDIKPDGGLKYDVEVRGRGNNGKSSTPRSTRPPVAK